MIQEEKTKREGVISSNGVDKMLTLNQAREFHKAGIRASIQRTILTRILYLIHTGDKIFEKEAESIFFGLTKLFITPNYNLHRLLFLGVKALRPSPDIVIVVTSSLLKDIAGENHSFHSNALRVLTQVVDNTFLQQVEKYFQAALVNSNPMIVSAGLLACLKLAKTNPESVRRWMPQVMECIRKNPSFIIQYHALLVALELGSNDLVKMMKTLVDEAKSITNATGQCLLIREAGRVLAKMKLASLTVVQMNNQDITFGNSSNGQQPDHRMLLLVENGLTSPSARVQLEAVKAILLIGAAGGNLSTSTSDLSAFKEVWDWNDKIYQKIQNALSQLLDVQNSSARFGAMKSLFQYAMSKVNMNDILKKKSDKENEQQKDKNENMSSIGSKTAPNIKGTQSQQNKQNKPSQLQQQSSQSQQSQSILPGSDILRLVPQQTLEKLLSDSNKTTATRAALLLILGSEDSCFGFAVPDIERDRDKQLNKNNEQESSNNQKKIDKNGKPLFIGNQDQNQSEDGQQINDSDQQQEDNKQINNINSGYKGTEVDKNIQILISTVAEEQKIEILYAVIAHILAVPKHYPQGFCYLAEFLRSEASKQFKTVVTDAIIMIMQRFPQAQEDGLFRLCEYIEDCDEPIVARRIIDLLADGTCAWHDEQYKRLLNNRQKRKEMNQRLKQLDLLKQKKDDQLLNEKINENQSLNWNSTRNDVIQIQNELEKKLRKQLGITTPNQNINSITTSQQKQSNSNVKLLLEAASQAGLSPNSSSLIQSLLSIGEQAQKNEIEKKKKIDENNKLNSNESNFNSYSQTQQLNENALLSLLTPPNLRSLIYSPSSSPNRFTSLLSGQSQQQQNNMNQFEQAHHLLSIAQKEQQEIQNEVKKMDELKKKNKELNNEYENSNDELLNNKQNEDILLPFQQSSQSTSSSPLTVTFGPFSKFNPQQYIRALYNRALIEESSIRSSAINALSKIAICCCFDDFDEDEYNNEINNNEQTKESEMSKKNQFGSVGTILQDQVQKKNKEEKEDEKRFIEKNYLLRKDVISVLRRLRADENDEVRDRLTSLLNKITHHQNKVKQIKDSKETNKFESKSQISQITSPASLLLVRAMTQPERVINDVQTLVQLAPELLIDNKPTETEQESLIYQYPSSVQTLILSPSTLIVASQLFQFDQIASQTLIPFDQRQSLQTSSISQSSYSQQQQPQLLVQQGIGSSGLGFGSEDDIFRQDDLGTIFKRSRTVALTESEAEYRVALTKIIYTKGIVLKYEVENTLDDQDLVNVSVECSSKDTIGKSFEKKKNEKEKEQLKSNVGKPLHLIRSVPIQVVGSGQRQTTYVVFARDQNGIPIGSVKSSLRFQAIEKNQSIHSNEPFEIYSLRPFDFAPVDFLAPTPSVNKDHRLFEEQWKEERLRLGSKKIIVDLTAGVQKVNERAGFGINEKLIDFRSKAGQQLEERKSDSTVKGAFERVVNQLSLTSYMTDLLSERTEKISADLSGVLIDQSVVLAHIDIWIESDSDKGKQKMKTNERSQVSSGHIILQLEIRAASNPTLAESLFTLI